jgi:hypothetical protein
MAIRSIKARTAAIAGGGRKPFALIARRFVQAVWHFVVIGASPDGRAARQALGQQPRTDSKRKKESTCMY